MGMRERLRICEPNRRPTVSCVRSPARASCMNCRRCCFSIWKRHHIPAYSAVVVYRWSAAFQPALEAASAGANCRLCSLFVVMISVVILVVFVDLVRDRPNIVAEVDSRHLVGVQHTGQESVTAVGGQLSRSTASCL